MEHSNEYVSDLQETLDHASEFAEVLRQLESEFPANSWLAGRPKMVIAAVNATLANRNSGAIDDTEAQRQIALHLKAMHKVVESIVGADRELDCCIVEEFKHAAEDELLAEGDSFEFDPAVTGVSRDEFETTIRKVWVDKPEVLARIRAEMPAAEAQAHAFKRKLGNACPFEDLHAYALTGLLDAARTFDGRPGVPFSAWAARHMPRAIIDGLRNWGNLPRKVLRKLKAYEAQLELEGQDANPDLSAAIEELKAYGPKSPDPVKLEEMQGEQATPEEIVATTEEKRLLGEIIDEMTTRRRTVVRRHYFDGDELQDIAANLGHSKSWASKRHAKAIETIRAELEARNIRSASGI